MPDGWRELILGDVVELKRGYDLPSSERRAGRVPIISSSGFSGWHNAAKVRGPGVVTGRYGTIGKVFFVTEDFWPLNTTLYVRDFKGNDERFISYFLRSLDFQSFNDKSSVPGLNRNDLHRCEVTVPLLAEQRAIASVLGALDAKIELNRATSAALERLAQAMFRAWFVDFEPVKAKAAGATAETFATLRKTLQDSPLGQLPEAWRVGKVRDLCARVENGGTPKRGVEQYWTPPEVPWLTSGEVRQSFVMKTDNYISKAGLDNSSAKLWPPYTTVVALYGATAGVATMLGVEVCANQACCGLLPTYAGCFVHQVLSTSLLQLQQRARGSAQQNLSQSIVADYECIVPSPSVLSAFERLASPIYEQCMHLVAESAKLAALRDYLLPKLLSGAVRVVACRSSAGEGIA